MIQEQAGAKFSDHAVSRIGFGAAVTMVACTFCMTLPIVAFLVGWFLHKIKAEAPRVPAFVIANSPWLPVLIGLAACVALIVKERRLKAVSAARVNAIAIATTLLVGG